MPTPTRNERLADFYLRAIGISGIYAVDEFGAVRIDWLPVITTGCGEGRTVLCVARQANAARLAQAAYAALPNGSDVAAAVAIIREIAAAECIGLTPLARVIERASATVAGINQNIEALSKSGEMRRLNQTFKAERARGGVSRYADFLHAHKERMLAALAAGRKP